MSTRFAVSVHILSALTVMRDEGPMPSTRIADSVGTSAVVVRQLLARLGAAGLVRSQLGPGGGSLLAREPATITLLEIYDAVETQPLLATPRCEPSKQCLVGANILSALATVTERAEAALRAELAAATIADIVREICARGHSEPEPTAP